MVAVHASLALQNWLCLLALAATNMAELAASAAPVLLVLLLWAVVW